MEAIWNYFYWQALSTNALDDIGHVLRLGVVVATAPRTTSTRAAKMLRGLQPVPRARRSRA